MATPTTSIDALPAKVAPVGTELLIVQDGGITKKMAINELVSLPSPALTAHLADTDDAHDASAVSATDSGNGINGVTVQAQLGQLTTMSKTASDAAAAADAKIVAHLADALDAHDASAVSAIANIILTGTDVQTQLNQIEAALVAGGTVGPPGPQGDPGPGVPAGGTANQLLRKVDATNFNTQWMTPLWLPLAGGTLTGALVLAADPAAALQAATKQYVDGLAAQATLDTRYVNVSGDTMTGALTVNAALSINGPGTLNLSAAGSVQPFRIAKDGQASAYIGFFPGSLGALGTRIAYMGCVNDDIRIINENTAPAYIQLSTPTAVYFTVGGTETARFDANNLLVGSTVIAHTDAGTNLYGTGNILVVTDTFSNGVQIGHAGAAADANGSIYVNFRRSTGGNSIASITQTSTTGVAYNTTSDERLKTFTRDVDDDEALTAVRAMRPLHFTWNDAPDDGEQIGFFAQELYEVAPEAVTPGTGEPGDGEDFVPWGTDLGKLVPRLVAAMQAMDNRFAEMKAEIAALRAELAS